MCRVMLLVFAVVLMGAGCGSVQKELTIKTEPAGALVLLNDEEVGTTPVTVSFNWYGDYRVRASLEGYRTLNTHKDLKGPWYDGFPFDLARLLWPARTVDRYEWTFELEKLTPPTREELIKSATDLQQTMNEAAR